MGRLRLQAQVLPWDDPDTFPDEKAYKDATIKMAQPCLEDDTVGDFLELVRERWAKTYVGYG